MIANLLAALRGQRSSRRYVGRHRLPDPPVPSDDAGERETEAGVAMTATEAGVAMTATEAGVAMTATEAGQTMMLPRLARPVDQR